MPEPDVPLLDAARVRAALGGSPFADVRVVAETASTNDDAAALLGDPAAAGATLVAEFQTAGRGRKAGRAWIAPAGSALLFTTILPDVLRASDLWAVPFWTALAVADGVEASTGVRLDLRWPNDLDSSGRKVAGILCTSRVAGDSAFVACGVGLNVRRPAPASIAGITPPPAYLSDAAGAAPAREDVLIGIVRAMTDLRTLPQQPAEIARAWEARAALRGRPYRVRLDAGGETFSGTALRLDPEGGLVLDAGGRERTVHLGDARVLTERKRVRPCG